MEFAVGSKIIADGDIYEVRGRILLKNQEDGYTWNEYRLFSAQFQAERWLSVDEVYGEYSLSKAAWQISTAGYHQVDSGTAEVVQVWGDADAEVGNTVTFTEYEDSTEEKIISEEYWDGEKETSTGYYLDANEFGPYNDAGGSDSYTGFDNYDSGDYTSNSSSPKNFKILTTAAIIGIFVLNMVISVCSQVAGGFGSPKIKKNIEKSGLFTYVTSMTGTNDSSNADVYKSLQDLDTTVRWIINSIDGNTQSVQQNTEDGDNSVAILTSKEYCLVYESEENEVLVQVSSRKYAYANDAAPYRCRQRTHRYYRRFYYSTGYYADTSSYGRKYSSPYSSFTDSTISSSSTDTYDNYSSSVRQSSVSTRTSSGGGLSSGK